VKARSIADLIAAGDLERLEREVKASGQTLASFATPFGSILHTAAAVGNVSMFKQILQASGVSVNKRSSEGSTPLHVAARAGKYEMVEFLMGCSDIDDTVRNTEDKTCIDVARNRQIVNIIECNSTERELILAYRFCAVDSRAVHVHRVVRQMHQAAKRADLAALKRLFPKDQSNLRNFYLVDVNEPDSSGDTILHTAARSDSPQLVQACLNLGADPFTKNRKGKIPLELARKEAIRKILKEGKTRTPSNPLILTLLLFNGTGSLAPFVRRHWTYLHYLFNGTGPICTLYSTALGLHHLFNR
jgi:ankyrin repeat protein